MAEWLNGSVLWVARALSPLDTQGRLSTMDSRLTCSGSRSTGSGSATVLASQLSTIDSQLSAQPHPVRAGRAGKDGRLRVGGVEVSPA